MTFVRRSALFLVVAIALGAFATAMVFERTPEGKKFIKLLDSKGAILSIGVCEFFWIDSFRGIGPMKDCKDY